MVFDKQESLNRKRTFYLFSAICLLKASAILFLSFSLACLLFAPATEFLTRAGCDWLPLILTRRRWTCPKMVGMLPIRRTRLFSRRRRTAPRPRPSTMTRTTPARSAMAYPAALPCTDVADYYRDLECPLGNVVMTDINELKPWLPIMRRITQEEAEQLEGCILYTPTSNSSKEGAKPEYYCITNTDDDVYGRACYISRPVPARETKADKGDGGCVWWLCWKAHLHWRRWRGGGREWHTEPLFRADVALRLFEAVPARYLWRLLSQCFDEVRRAERRTCMVDLNTNSFFFYFWSLTCVSFTTVYCGCRCSLSRVTIRPMRFAFFFFIFFIPVIALYLQLRILLSKIKPAFYLLPLFFFLHVYEKVFCEAP